MTTPGFVIVPQGEQARFNAFEACLTRLLIAGIPEGSGLIRHQGVDIPYLINHGIRRMLADPNMQWAWIIGDDHTFDPDIIVRLLAHELPVVVPLVLRRNAPHQGVCYDAEMKTITWTPDQSGLQRVHAAGNAGMLIRRSVLEDVGDPWFTYGTAERACEDLTFCTRLDNAGIPLHVDLDTWMGHITPVEVWPKRTASGAWTGVYRNNLTMEVL